MAANQGVPPRFFDTLKRSIASEEAMLCFLNELDVSLAHKQAEQILLDLLACDGHRRDCLELVLSVGAWASPLGEWLSRSFPTTLPVALDKGTHAAVLLRLVQYVHFHWPRGQDGGSRPPTQDDLTLASHGPEVIKQLLNLRFDDDKSDRPGNKLSTGHRSRKSIGQADRKWHSRSAFRKQRAMSLIDEAEAQFYFLRVLSRNISIPASVDEAHELAAGLLLELKVLLKKYTAIIRADEASEALISSFLLQKTTHAQSVKKPVIEPINTNINGSSRSSQKRQRTESADFDAMDMISPITASAFDTPLKSALYFDTADDLGDWEIVLSGRAVRDLRAAHRKNPASYNIIMKKINELSCGYFFGDNQKLLVGGPDAVSVYEAKMTGNSRLVYHIHCQPDHSIQLERQVIRVFGVFTHAQLNRVWESLGYQLAYLGGREYHKRCAQRVYNSQAGKTTVIPAVFPPKEVSDEVPLAIPSLPVEDLEEIHSILVLEKFVKLSNELRNSFVADLDVLPVFNLSATEMEIIEHPFSCYVLGRSGTGKTTTMLFKILGLERTFASLSTFELAKPRQLFVTKSPVLAARVEDYFTKLLGSLELGKESESALVQLAERKARHDTSDEPRAMVHKKDIQGKSNLPEKFSLLEEDHFPLFLTFEQLTSLIISDFLDPDSDWMLAKRRSLSRQENVRLDQLLRLLSSSSAILGFTSFLVNYWPHFPQNLTKGLDPALVFSEILGVIQGAEQSITDNGRYMDKDTYLSLGERANYIFASKREIIYQLFKKYSKRKSELKDYDAADRTRALLEVFGLVGVPGVRVDFLYVDEAQDNMLIDAKLLRSMCKNPQGLFWAGDTAQTITVGNSFRFQDLKAFLYRLEEQRLEHYAYGNSTSKPANFELATNYRSHGGIIACAHSVIEIITCFWPTSLDKMAPEKGMVAGVKPLFLRNGSAANLRFRDLMTNEEKPDIEFGAAQCILVRDADARKRLLEEVGEVGIVMTLLDSKGLEFDDVLLYEFFEDSTVDLSRWRILLNMLPESPPAPAFDPDRHASLCSELKFLYVAITRARKKLWIYDTSDKAGPLQLLWTSLHHIEDFDISSGKQLPRFASSSSREEWQEAADRLFDNENYLQAAEAYKRANSSRQEAVARAYQLRKEAEVAVVATTRKTLFLDAANAFLKCAAQAVNRSEPKTFRRIAGSCFYYAEEYPRAAEAYRAAEEYANALRMYRKVGMFDEGVHIVKHYEPQIRDKALVDEFRDVAKVFYFKDQKLSEARELFTSTEQTLAYLEENDYLDQSRALLLETLKKNIEAAEVHLSEGRLLEAIRVLLSNPQDIVAVSRGHDVIVQGLWQAMSFGNAKHITNSDVEYLVQQATALPEHLRHKVSIFLLIHRGNWKEARTLCRQFFLDGRQTEALLCLSYALHPSNLPEMYRLHNLEIVEVLTDIVTFCQSLRDQAETLSLRDEEVQRLFSFRPSGIEDTYVLCPGTWLHRASATPDRPGSENLPVPSQTLERRLKDALMGFAAEVIRNESDQCRSSLASTPCLPFALTGYCRFGDGCYRQHLARRVLDQRWYSAQIRMHLQQVLLSQIIESIPSHLGGGSGRRRDWLNRLYQTLAPSSYFIGSGLGAAWPGIPEWPKAMTVVHNWCRHLLTGRPGQVPNLELSSVYQAAEFCFHWDREQAVEYVPRSRLILVHLYRDPSFWRDTNSPRVRQAYVLLELVRCLDGSSHDFLQKGVYFADHVIRKHLPININILCNFLEFLCGSFIAVQHHCHWHNITLPRSWLLLLVPRLSQQLPLANTRPLLGPLMRALNQLLHILTTGEHASHLQYGTKPNGNAEPLAVRRLFVSRICRAMCFIGYNIPNDWIHKFTLEQLQPLKTSEKHGLYAPFALADTWKQVVHAVWNSTRDSPFDDLVQLWSGELRLPTNPPPNNITRVVFKKISDIIYLLRRETPPEDVSSPVTNPHAHDRHPSTHPEGLVGTESAVEVDASLNTPLVGEDGTDAQETFASGPEDDMIHQDAHVHESHADIPTIELGGAIQEAAKVLYKAYQRLLRRRERESKRLPREVAYHNFYLACAVVWKNSGWPIDSSYRKYYLGVVPHLLVVAQWVEAYVIREKAAAKEALRAAQGKDLEAGPLERIAQISVLGKDMKKLVKALEPRSHFHTRCDTQELLRLVEEVRSLFKRLPRAHSGEVRFDMYMAMPPAKAHQKVLSAPLLWIQEEHRYRYDDQQLPSDMTLTLEEQYHDE